MATIHELPVSNREAAREFLATSIRDHIHIVAIAPDGQPLPYGRWFGDDVDGAVAWAMAENVKGHGVYWTVNIVEPRFDRKPKKRNIIGARFLHVDVDPPKDGSAFDRQQVLDDLSDQSVPPSFVIDSGGGLQAFWRLEYVAENCPAIELLNQSLEDVFGGDHCFNIDRLMRLPGTVNYPNRKKRSEGRVPTVASIAVEDAGESADPEHMRRVLPTPTPRGPDVERAGVDLGEVVPLDLAALGINPINRLFALLTAPTNPDRSAATFAATCEMVRQDFTDTQIAGVLVNPALAISGHSLDQASPLRAINRVIGRARADVGAAQDEVNESGNGGGNRPAIRIRAGDLHLMATEAEDALMAANAPLYVRGGLVRPVVDDMPAAHGRRTRVSRLLPVDADMLVDHLSRAIGWERFNARKNAYTPTDPPHNVAATILSRDGEWRLPPLSGVITAPTLRPDGTILSEPGYDPETRLLLLEPPEIPTILEKPGKDEATAAIKKLDELLNDFPFVDLASRAVALSALITPVVRGAMPVAPLHASTAPVAGSGKSYLWDLASTILTGERAPVLAAGRTEEETEKRLAAALLNGQAIVSIDNVNGQLGGDALCQMIERPVVAIRPLGVSKLVKIENRATAFATGNNIQLVGDMTRRTVLCSLDPMMERPELRQFKTNPVEMILSGRGGYIAAALTVVRAYIVAGYPGELPPLASFETWSRLVRSAIVWLGYADPILTMEATRADDPVLTQLGAVLESWHGCVGSGERTTGSMIEAAQVRNTFGQLVEADLYAALFDVAEDRRGGLSAKRLGHFLGQHQGRIVAGKRAMSGFDGHAKQKVWRIECV